jgi:hypothetical protein
LTTGRAGGRGGIGVPIRSTAAGRGDRIGGCRESAAARQPIVVKWDSGAAWGWSGVARALLSSP